jgi:GNAT superfamily N-acetyltransferase
MTQGTEPMQIDVSLEPLERIRTLRDLYRKEMNCQIILDSWHQRGWTDSYLLRLNGRVVGYGSVGGVRAEQKDNGAVAATGGILFHYNPPYGDIYMAVAEPFRRRGYGSYLVQELKRTCYGMGKIPAARCNASNAASRATLQKAGFLPCARILSGQIADS